MASKSEPSKSKLSKSKPSNKRGAEGEKKERAALPFEPGRDHKQSNKANSSAKQSSALKASSQSNKSKASRPNSRSGSKSDGADSGISARAQARVDEIRASNRRKAEAKAEAKRSKQSSSGHKSRDEDGKGGIPAAVSKRMLRRMAVLSLGPIALGVGIFFLSYYLLSQEILEFAPVVVLLTTMGCFGLGVVGLSYGMLSASWDEEPGDLIGMDEFKLNLGRMKDAWRESRQSKI